MKTANPVLDAPFASPRPLALVRTHRTQQPPAPVSEVTARGPCRSVCPRRSQSAPLVAECLEEAHPVLDGRARVRVLDGATELARWVSVLQGLVLRPGDRVLLQRPTNWPEPVVVGVLDGFKDQRERSRTPAAALELRADEVLEVRSREGQRLVEIWEGADGPVVRILRRDADLRLDGKLSVQAREILLSAREGVRVEADGNLDLAGDAINLN